MTAEGEVRYMYACRLLESTTEFQVLENLGDYEEHVSYLDLKMTSQSSYIGFVNIEDTEFNAYGIVQLTTGHYHNLTGRPLENVDMSTYFVKPLEPTQSELTMFELEHGIEYPVLPFLKEKNHV